MSMDISRLAIEVTSTGIREASTALQGRNGAGGLVGAADKAEKRVTALTASLSKLTSVNSSATFAAMNAALGNMSTTMQAVVSQAKALGDALEKATGSQKNFHFHTENVTGALHRKVRVSQVALNTIKAMTTAAIAYAGVGFAQSIIKQSDAWASLEARLTVATGSANNGRKALEDMYDVSQRLRVPVEANARLFARMAPAMQKMGKTGEETVKVVEGIATALQLNGATGGEAASVMLQLSQSFGSGVLNGAEFNAVAENGSKIMEALADYTGKTKGELKKMGAEGKLSVQTMNEAILAALPQWQKEFDTMPVTVEGAMQRVKNAWTKAIGEMGKEVGLNVELAKALKIIEDMMPAVAQGLAGAFVDVVKWVETNKTMLGEIWEQIKGIGKTVWEAAGFMATLGTNAATVGGEINVIAIALKGVRYVFAAIEDIVRGIKVGVGAVGVVLGGIVTLATELVGGILGRIVQVFSGLMDALSTAADAVGEEGLAAGLASAAKGADGISKGLLSASDKTLEYTKSLMNVTGGWVDEMAKGKFAVRDLWNEEERVTKEKERQKLLGQELARRGRPLTYDSNWKLGTPKPPEVKASAAETAQKAFEKSLADAQAMTKAQAELNRRMDEYVASFDKMTPSQKEVIRLREQLMLLEKSGKNVTEIANTKTMLAEKERTARLELLGARMKEVLQENQDGLDKEATSLKSLTAELVNAQAKLDNFGKAPGNERQGAVDALAKEIEALQQIPDLLAAQANPAFIAAKKERLEVMKQLLAVESEIGQKEVLAELDKMLDPSKAKNFGEALAGSLGEASKAAGAVGKAIQNYNARLAVTDKLKEKLSKVGGDEVKKAQYLGEIQKREAIDQMASYADMASAAKTFFKEKTAGYKMLEGVEKTYRAFQMALQVKSFLQDIGFLQASTAATVTANNTKAASDVSASTTAVNAAMIEGQAKAASGVANQAGGDPYTAWFRMAAMAAVMAGLGFAVSGGSGSASTSASRQAKAGTGTVFGAPDAKSESISKGIEILSENSDIALEHSSGMLRSLLNIEASLTGATNAILRNSGSITGRGFEGGGRTGASWLQSTVLLGPIGALADRLLGGTISKMLGFGSKSTLKDSGITAGNQNVGSVLSGGFKGNTYQDVETTKKALFVTYSKSTNRALGVLDETIETEFTNVIQSMVEGISSAAEGLGKDSNTVRAALEAMTIPFGDLSFKDMSAEEIQKQLEAIFSGIGDEMAKTAFGEMLDAFQQAGEGLMETAIRVANGIDVASYELDKLGLTAINFADIINKSGDVAAEIVRQSIMLVETGTGIGNIVNTLSGSASEIAKTYTDLLTARNALQGLSIADDVSVALIRAAGGLESLLDALQSYSERYFTDQERQAMETSRLQKEFAKLGQTMPATKAGFRTMIETLSASGATGQEAAMKLLLLNEAFADLMDNADALKQEAIDTARNNLSDAYEREADALRTTKERFEEFAKSLTEFRFSLLLGDQSTLTNAEKYATAKARYEATAAAALAGDQTAQDSFQSVAQEFLSFSRIMNASGSAYQSDFANVLAQTTALEEMAKGQATMAEKQLAALDAQVAGLLTVNESVLTVAEAIAALTALLEPTSGLGNRVETPVVDNRANALSSDGSYVMDYSQYGAANTQALVAEIQMLRTEVSSLRSEQAAQTSALIASNYDANAQNANAVVDGTKDAAQQAVYNSKATVALV